MAKVKIDCLKKIRALSDESRLKIMYLLMQEPACVNTLSKRVRLKHYNISKHLKILENAQLVSQKKEGQKRVYFLPENLVRQINKDKNKLVLGCCTFDFARLKL